MKRKIIPYKPYLKEKARYLRNNSTKSEIYLWKKIKGKQIHGYDFHRQKPLLDFIADFYCRELELVIELDGFSHQFEDVISKDKIKQAKFENIGLSVLRFQDSQVFNDIDSVVDAIKLYITKFEETHR